MVAAAIRTIFAQPEAEQVKEQFDVVARRLGPSAEGPDDVARGKEDLLAVISLPQVHWCQVWSTNPLERVNKERKRGTDVVGAFPNPGALLLLAGGVLVEQHDEWAATDRHYCSERSMTLVTTTTIQAEGQVTSSNLMIEGSRH